MPGVTGCFICESYDAGNLPLIHEDDLILVGHMASPGMENVYLGYFFVMTRRHVASIGDLSDDEAGAVGRMANRMACVVRDVVAAEKVYIFTLGDHVQHFHLHVAPRYPGTPRELWGSSIGDWAEAPRGGQDQVDDVCARVRAAL